VTEDTNEARRLLRDADLRQALYTLMWERYQKGKARTEPCGILSDEMLLGELRRILGGGSPSITERLTNLTMYVLAGSVAALILAGVVRLVGLILGL